MPKILQAALGRCINSNGDPMIITVAIVAEPCGHYSVVFHQAISEIGTHDEAVNAFMEVIMTAVSAGITMEEENTDTLIEIEKMFNNGN